MVHVSIEIKRIGAGMLGEQMLGVGEVSRVEIKRRRLVTPITMERGNVQVKVASKSKENTSRTSASSK